ncbi:SMR family transporter [Bacillus sp. JJ1521]|uniref:DMT family transporter n=1 Tax=Bacillus sp. JJ1521 TaxID=3122957 RepID=UPI0030001F96
MYVILTCVFELLWIFGFNVANTWWHWTLIIPVIIVDFIVLSKACELLPTGTVYAIFAAAGTVGTSLMDVFIFGERFIMEKGFFIGLLVIGVIALNLADNKSSSNVESKEGVA